MEEYGLPVGQVVEQSQERSCRRASRRLQLKRDDVFLDPGVEGRDVHAERNEAVLALEPLARCLGGDLRRREERVDPCAKAITA